MPWWYALAVGIHASAAIPVLLLLRSLVPAALDPGGPIEEFVSALTFGSIGLLAAVLTAIAAIVWGLWRRNGGFIRLTAVIDGLLFVLFALAYIDAGPDAGRQWLLPAMLSLSGGVLLCLAWYVDIDRTGA